MATAFASASVYGGFVALAVTAGLTAIVAAVVPVKNGGAVAPAASAPEIALLTVVASWFATVSSVDE